MASDRQAPRGPQPKPPAGAQREGRRRGDFTMHLLGYLLTNALLVALWALIGFSSGNWFPWFLIPLLVWGVGVGYHAWAAYRGPGHPTAEDAIDREFRRL